MDTGITFPRLKSIGSSLGSQYYKETGNAFSWIVPSGFLVNGSFSHNRKFQLVKQKSKAFGSFGDRRGFGSNVKQKQGISTVKNKFYLQL